DAGVARPGRWAASGRLPPGLAARFTQAEVAVLALVAAEVARRSDCRLAIENLAAVPGVSSTTVKNAIREDARFGLLTVEERQITGWRNATNVVRITSREWTAWLRLARRTLPSGGGVKSATTTNTQVLDLRESRKTEPKKGCREAAVDLGRSDRTRIRAGGGSGRAMR
ncbi:helix-turn-helix domain-containing protein, partial [Methylobacterium sp. J-030]|nr:helix-turn-helix domain-containing protein [Methylobacterium sp. J-030]